MTIVVLLFLAVIWGLVLFGYVRERLADAGPADSIGSFHRQLSVLERTDPNRPVVGRTLVTPSARRTTTAQRRRRDIITGLSAAVAGTLLLALVTGARPLWGLQVLSDVLLVGYVALLVRLRLLLADREAKLRFLPSSSTPEPALLLRRTGN